MYNHPHRAIRKSIGYSFFFYDCKVKVKKRDELYKTLIRYLHIIILYKKVIIRN